MHDFQQRVVDEKAELDSRTAKLTAFRETEFFKTIPSAQRELMNVQCSLMVQLSAVLGSRIALFTE